MYTPLNIKKIIQQKLHRKKHMTTIIDRNNGDNSNAGWAVLVVVLMVVIGLGIAYFNGAFMGTNEKTIEKTTVIENKTVVLPAEKPVLEVPVKIVVPE